jgi:hypothetical protein
MSITVMKQALDFIERTANFVPISFDNEGMGIAAMLSQAIAEAEKQERNFCSRCGKRLGKNDWDVHTCTPPAAEKQEPVAWMCNKDFEPIRIRIMHEAYELADRNDSEGYNAIKVMCGEIQKMLPPQRQWVGLMRGVRVEGDTVVISTKGGNEAARELCGALIEEMNR